MLEYLNHIDTQIFLFLNAINHPVIDEIMLFLSYSMIPIIIILLVTTFFGHRYFHKKVFLLLFLALISFGLTDSVSSRIFKPSFKRLRPCHAKELRPVVHTAGKKCWGGKYGFVSSHAANTFGIAFFLWLVFRRKNKYFFLLIPYAGLVSYSRVYLAKHYPFDILAGGILGLFFGVLCYLIWKKILVRMSLPSPDLQ